MRECSLQHNNRIQKRRRLRLCSFSFSEEKNSVLSTESDSHALKTSNLLCEANHPEISQYPCIPSNSLKGNVNFFQQGSHSISSQRTNEKSTNPIPTIINNASSVSQTINTEPNCIDISSSDENDSCFSPVVQNSNSGVNRCDASLRASRVNLTQNAATSQEVKQKSNKTAERSRTVRRLHKLADDSTILTENNWLLNQESTPLTRNELEAFSSSSISPLNNSHSHRLSHNQSFNDDEKNDGNDRSPSPFKLTLSSAPSTSSSMSDTEKRKATKVSNKEVNSNSDSSTSNSDILRQSYQKRLINRQKLFDSDSFSDLENDLSYNLSPNAKPSVYFFSCAICLNESISSTAHLGFLATCQHLFCFDCISRWSNVTNCCPLCKERFHSIQHYKFVNKLPVKDETYKEDLIVLDKDIKSLTQEDENDEEYTDLEDLYDSDNAFYLCVHCSSNCPDNDYVICEGCYDSFHMNCAGLSRAPRGLWFCSSCSGIRRGQNRSHRRTGSNTVLESLGRRLMLEVLQRWSHRSASNTRTRNARRRRSSARTATAPRRTRRNTSSTNVAASNNQEVRRNRSSSTTTTTTATNTRRSRATPRTIQTRSTRSSARHE